MTYTCPSLRDRVVIVTGASRGLGREMALELAGAGCRVVICGSADTPELRATASEAEELAGTGSVLVHIADVAHADACDELVSATLNRFDRVDVLINNAGRGMRLISETFNTVPTRFWEAKPADWRAIIDTNVNGAFYMARAVAPHMVAQRFGKIINISTSDQTMVRKGYSPYGPSKAALEAASRVWAQDLEGTGVDVNVYLPGGAADTDLLPPSGIRRGADGNLLPSSIMRRAIGWLCSDASNGQTGGRYIARLWNETLPAAEAAAAARSPQVDRPAIM
jgi:NAD(P)-dependent dehydrogenase (short-subunit alcohol dehydrogenase family)